MTTYKLEKDLLEEVNNHVDDGYANVMFGDDQIVIGTPHKTAKSENQEWAMDMIRYLRQKHELQYFLHSCGNFYFTLFKLEEGQWQCPDCFETYDDQTHCEC